jgi:hypothetical protein
MEPVNPFHWEVEAALEESKFMILGFFVPATGVC